MTISSAGPVCDVCGKYILLESFHNFTVEGIKPMLQCHDKCKSVLEAAVTEKDWTMLPIGPLRWAFEENFKPAPTPTASSGGPLE